MCRLLLLEDDRGLIDGLKYSLEKNGFDLDVARTVREARHALRGGHPYDLLLLDVTLPDGNGFMVCEEARMDRLIRMLLRVTRLDAGSVHFRKQKIYAADLVKNGLDHTQNGGHVTVS